MLQNNIYKIKLEDFTYYYAGLNTLAIVEGNFLFSLNCFEQLVSTKVTINTTSKLTITNDIVNEITNHQANHKSKIICTLPYKIQLQLKKKLSYNYLLGLAEDETKWYTKDSIINFRQTISDYNLPNNLLKSIPQFLRADGEDIKTLISFTKTVEFYLIRKKNHLLLFSRLKRTGNG